jgi:lauroyl/myristoyl acyltransferase
MALLSWKSAFYRAILPSLRRLGPERSEAVLDAIAKVALLDPRWATLIGRATDRAAAALPGGADPGVVRRLLPASIVQSLARDVLLDGLDDRRFEDRFDVEGFEHVVAALAAGNGLILVHAHFGAFLPGLHWLYRQDLPMRSLIQRPHHVSADLNRHFDRGRDPHPQPGFFLRRLPPAGEAAALLLRARALLREGLALSVCGDVPWNTGAEADWLGRRWRILDHWTHLAAATGAAVVPAFALHLPRGRFGLRFEAPRRVTTAGTGEALAWYLARLEGHVRRHPAQAIAYWTWPSYRLPVEVAGAGLGSSDALPAAPFRTVRRTAPAG